MRLCVVDCSFAMAWMCADEKNALADELLARIEQADSIVVPAVLWALEVRNALRTAVRRKRLTAVAAEAMRLSMLDLPRITVSCPPGLGDELDRLVRECELTSYDAVYLAVAMEHGLPLATRDEQLATAARKVRVGRFGE
jgi:predicted nucleic acid-binding protein